MQINFKEKLHQNDIQKFSEGGAYTNIGKNFYFTGGEEKRQTFLQIKVNENNNNIAELIELPSMINPHSKHSMIGNDKYLFVIGGYASNKCEYFDMQTLQWNKMPDLISEERQRPMLLINDGYLYAFMGFTQTDLLNSIEKFNIKEIKTSKWENVNALNPIKFYGSGIYANYQKIFFFGGKWSKGTSKKDYKNHTIYFDLEKNEFKEMGDAYDYEQYYFIENEFHQFSDDELVNFSYVNHGQFVLINKKKFNYN